MIIRNEQDITQAVLAELDRATDPRFKEIMQSAVRHLHAFVREARLTEAEFQQACAVIARVGQATTASHNEVVLAAGSLGVSSLICLLNNGGQAVTEMPEQDMPGHGAPEDGVHAHGQAHPVARGTTANLLGPFWRMGSPATEPGASIVRSPTPGDPIFVEAWVKDPAGQPVAGAEVDVWHSSNEGFYENQDPAQADMNLRGKFVTDADGRIAFRSVKPAGYPIPVTGPVGDLLRAQGRHNMRPAHIHFLIFKEGYKTQFSQVYSSDDPHLDTDVQFGVTEALVGHYERHGAGSAPAPDVTGPWYSLKQTFVVEPGVAKLPRPPISGKADGPRPTFTVLQRT
ncbi:dioxygenase [Pigmentiphaga litoralis]|uniref:dioxygenase family protein n=1 Tax=Pigmentiphaga litoralis TaxID=516702 RepID=UPI003B433437